MITHSEDRQILIRKKDGTSFQAAVTHREKKGVHWVVVTAAEKDLPELRDNAPALLALIVKQQRVRLDAIRYFERGRDGAVFAVNTHNVALPATSPASGPASTEHLRRGVWCDETDLKKRLGEVRLPEIRLFLKLAEKLTEKMAQGINIATLGTIGQQAPKAAKPVVRTRLARPQPVRKQQPRLPRP